MTTPTTRLTVTVWDRPDAAPRTWELIANDGNEEEQEEAAAGTHPDPGGAISAIAAATRPFEPVPRDAMCTQIYGGPQRARIEGVWRGQPVSASYDKRNGCEIARWKTLSAVLDA